MRKIYKISSVILGLLFIVNINAQISRIDSLKQLLTTPVADTFKINSCNHLSEYYMFSNPDSGLFYANVGLGLAMKIKDGKGIGIGYRLLALNYHFLSKNDSAILFIDKAYGVFEEIKYKDGMVICLMNKGIFQSKIDEPEKAINNYYQVFGLFKEDSNFLGMANCNVNIGIILSEESDYINAIKKYIEADQFFKEEKNIEGIASCKLNIGTIYFHLKEYGKAIEYFTEGLPLFQELNNKIKEAMLLNNMGSCYKNIGLFDSALLIHHKALKIQEEGKDKNGMAKSLENIGSVYFDMKEYDHAMVYYNKALFIKETLNSKKELASLYYNIGSVEYRTKYSDKALINANMALECLSEVDDLRLKQDVYKLLYSIYKDSHNSSRALEAHERYSAIKDSIFDAGKYEIINNLEKKYQTAEKEKANQKLQFENELQKQENAKIKARNMSIWAFSGFVLILLGIAFFVYRNFEKNKINKLMLKEIDEQNDIISKNLHDGMSGYLHAIKNRLVFRNEKTNDLDSDIEIIDRSQKELRFLMKQLSSPYYKNKNFDLSQELNELNSFYENTSSFKIDSYFDKSIIWKNISYENKLHIYKLAQELLANVKKHSGASNISLQIIKDKNNLVISFEDDGKGFDPEETSYGYGLKNIDKRIKELRGELNIDSSIGQGTFITLKIPVLS